MPRLTDSPELQQHNHGHFGFSAVRIEDLGATEYTLVTAIVDVSGSVRPFAKDLEACVKNVVESCRKSPRADNLLFRLLAFSSDVKELHGFKPLADCNPADYDDMLRTYGSTALYDATVDGIEALTAYGKTLTDNDFGVNGLVVVLTDGDDNMSKMTKKRVKEVLADAVTKETMESLLSILVGVNVQDPMLSTYLKEFQTEGGFSQYVELKDASPKTLAKLADFVSKSVSSQSLSLGSGGPSRPLTF